MDCERYYCSVCWSYNLTDSYVMQPDEKMKSRYEAFLAAKMSGELTKRIKQLSIEHMDETKSTTA